MQLCTRFDDERIREYVARGARPVFTIYWEHEGRPYPADDWIDFGTVILGWWLVQAKALFSDGTSARLDFMDGPFSLLIERSGQLLRVEAHNEEVVWDCTVEEFIKSLRAASWSVIRRLDDLAVAQHDRDVLQQGLRMLSEAME